MAKYTCKRILSSALLSFLVLVGLFYTFSSQAALAQSGPPVETSSANLYEPSSLPIPPFAPGIVLVGLRGDVVAAADGVPWNGIEVLAVEPLDLRGGVVMAASDDGVVPDATNANDAVREPLTGYKLTVPVGTEWVAIDALSARGDVGFAEPNWLVQIAQDETTEVEPVQASAETPFAVSDTLYPEQWYMQRIGMSRAWALAESAGSLSTVDVVVIDTGADFSHPDLANQLGPGRNYVDDDLPPIDDNGHGSHVSGLIAGAANGTGMVGVGLAVEIIPYKALDGEGLGWVDVIAQAVRDAADEGADILNLSLELRSNSFVLASAVAYAVDQGVLVIAASGNRALSSVSYPAAYPSVLAVGASSYYDTRAYYSNKGTELDIVAPGGLSDNSILSAWTSNGGATCPSGLRQVNGGRFCNSEGTSMATGVVSGVAALIMSLRPDLDAGEVQTLLLDSAAPIIGTQQEVGRGRIDAAQAVRLALRPELFYVDGVASVSASETDGPFMVTLSLSNPSLEPLQVEMTPTISTTWYTLNGPSVGEVSYGKPLDVQLLFTPTAVGVGTFQSSLIVTATTESGGTSVYYIPTRLDVHATGAANSQMFLAWVGQEYDGSNSFHWAEPTFTPRIDYAIGSDGSIVVDLPFTMTVNKQSYRDIRIFADGFVVASAFSYPSNLPNHCLANQLWPSFSVYGWWSDLGLDANSTLSTFQPDPDHYVVEYNNFVSMTSSVPGDAVSFQIVLSRDGEIELNYAAVTVEIPTNITVGASVQDGRFYNQITCHQAGTVRIGEAPSSYQSFRFHNEDLY